MFEVLSGWEIQFLLFIQNHVRIDAMNWFWQAVSFLGEVGWFWILLTIVLLCLARYRKQGLASAISILIAFIVNNLTIKNLVARMRPYQFCTDLHPVGILPEDYSFPSGHTCIAFACALVLVRMMPKKIGIPSVVLAAVIAFSRMYLGMHYPSDILGALIVSICSSCIAVPLTEKIYQRKSSKTMMK